MRKQDVLAIRQRNSEKGSALLIVFVFAAVIAIMLYRELPSATLEAERQREQELQDRGQEYVRAVQLFYRKNARYPGSMEALEDTNRVRYLRQRFKDPLTGKDDWRLLHAGPGGTLIDSKVNRLGPMGQMGPNGAGRPGSNGQGRTSGGSSFGQSSSSSFGGNGNNSALLSGVTTGLPATGSDGSTFGPGGAFANSSFSSDSGPAINSLYRKRPPAIATANAPTLGNTGASPVADGMAPSSADLAADPTIPLVGGGTQAGAGNGPDNNNNGVNVNANGMNGANGAASNAAGSNTMQAVGNLLANGQAPANNGLQNNSGPQSVAGSSNQQLNSGGIAGVASKAKGKTLKKVADQKDFSLWEFYYDPNQDTSMKAAGSSGPAGGAINQNPNGTTTNGQGIGGQGQMFTPATTGFNNTNTQTNNANPNGTPNFNSNANPNANNGNVPPDSNNPNNQTPTQDTNNPNNSGAVASPPPVNSPGNQLQR